MTFLTTKKARILKKKTAQTMNLTKTAVFHSMMMKTAQQAKEDDLEDRIEYIKGSTKEADEQMLTQNITNWVESQKNEMVPSSSNCCTKPRKTNQKSCRGESRTHHLDKDSKESRRRT